MSGIATGRRRASTIDFLIIGAAKSATTWLQQALQRHPDVVMPEPELHFFSRDYDRGFAWYLSQFPEPRGRGVVGEKSNSYLHEAPSAARVARHLPEARFVVQVRDPVERAYSDYCMLYRRGEVDADVARHLDPRRAHPRFLGWGLYARQMQPWLESFAAGRFLFLDAATIRTDRRSHLDRVLGFLDLDPCDLGGTERRVKDRRTAEVPARFKPILRPFKPLVAPLRGTRLFRQVHAGIARPVSYPPLPAETRRRLEDFFHEPNLAFRELSGLDLGRPAEPRPPHAATAHETRVAP